MCPNSWPPLTPLVCDMHTPCCHFDCFLMCSNWLSWWFICSSIGITCSILFANSDLYVTSILAYYPGFMHGRIDLDVLNCFSMFLFGISTKPYIDKDSILNVRSCQAWQIIQLTCDWPIMESVVKILWLQSMLQIFVEGAVSGFRDALGPNLMSLMIDCLNTRCDNLILPSSFFSVFTPT